MSACLQGEDVIGQTWQRNQVSVEMKDEVVVEEEGKKKKKSTLTESFHDMFLS